MQLTYPKPKKAGSVVQQFSSNRLSGTCFGNKVFNKTTTLTICFCSLDNNNLDVLKYYPNLERLTIIASGVIENLLPLANCHRLDALMIDSTVVKTLAGIEYCSELHELDIFNVTLEDLAFLNGLPIRRLVLCGKSSGYHPQYIKLSSKGTFGNLPEDLPELHQLNCSSSSITSIPSYPMLEVLDCPACSITRIEHSPKLKLVKFESNDIQDLEFLRGCPVEILNCGSNMITSLDPLEGTGVQYLKCDNNQLTRLTYLPEVADIICTENQILTLRDLQGSDNLVSLECRRNRLINLQGLEQMMKLRTLDVAENDIFDPSAIKDLDLVFINLERNMIMHLPTSIFTERRRYDSHGNCRYHFNKNLIENVCHLPVNPKIICDLTDNPLKAASKKRINVKGTKQYLN